MWSGKSRRKDLPSSLIVDSSLSIEGLAGRILALSLVVLAVDVRAILFVLITVHFTEECAVEWWRDVVDALEVRVHGVPLALNSHVEPFKAALHPVNFEVEPVEGVGDGGKVGPGLGFGWASGSGRGRCPSPRTGTGGGDRGRWTRLLRFDDPGHDVEDETAFGICGVDGGAAHGIADELGDANLVEGKALVVEHLVLSAIMGDIVALEGETGDPPKLFHGKLNRRGLDEAVDDVVLTPEVGVEGPDQHRVDLLSSPGDERPKARLMKLRV
ncbi:unnamed protein product [Cuscuta campestris]|uniref:Uncharacterized protein n=1 Tax=Cuscuta campestris TaxID=132261 RepID=A0A484KND0_9ASTE|nr:unnamed protein product [Cuscuta campestris]